METVFQRIKAHVTHCQEITVVNIDKDHTWSLLRGLVAEISPQLPGWTVDYQGSSVSFRSAKTTVKVTTGREVFVDRKLGHLKYESEKFIEKSIEAAIARFIEVITPYLISPVVH